MRLDQQLEQRGFARIRVPTCPNEEKRYKRKLDHIRGLFGDRIEERETEINGRTWIEFVVVR